MNIVAGYNDKKITPQSKDICRFYIRGMCRFGNRCRNIHEQTESTKKTPEKKNPEKSEKPSSSPGGSSQASGKSASSSESNSTTEQFGPGTSTGREAINLVRRAQSVDKSCGICFDTIVQKTDTRDQVFGILPNCNHCFCFSCIRKWRQSKEFELDVAKGCPECRIASDFVYASRFWLEETEEKTTFIATQKNRMQKMDCKYFKRGVGKCPFGNTCLYLHALPNGKKMDVGPPRPRRRRPSDVDTEMVHQLLFWLNDDDDDDIEYDNDDFELDLDDPSIACQYYDHDDIRRYIALNRLMDPSDSDEDSDFGFMF